MVTCANCPREALYTYEVSQDYLIHYCQNHLPRFLTSHKNAGLLGLKVTAPVVEEAPVVTKTKKEKKEETVVEEPVVEDSPTEDAPEEE